MGLTSYVAGDARSYSQIHAEIAVKAFKERRGKCEYQDKKRRGIERRSQMDVGSRFQGGNAKRNMPWAVKETQKITMALIKTNKGQE